MTTLKLTTGEWLGVTVPEGASNFTLSIDKSCMWYNGGPDFWSRLETENFPPGSSLPFPCVAGEMTEEQAGQIVKDNGMGCWDNYKGIPDNRYTCLSATESLLSLCRANGLNPSTTILLKVNN